MDNIQALIKAAREVVDNSAPSDYQQSDFVINHSVLHNLRLALDAIEQQPPGGGEAIGMEVTQNNIWVGTMKKTPFGEKCDDIWFGMDFDQTLTNEAKERRIKRACLIVETVNAHLSPAPSVTSEDWKPATTDTNPLTDGYYLTIYRRSEWADGHYVHKVCRFDLGNNCTGNIWDATVGERLWNVKFWMPLPHHPLTQFNVSKKK